MDAIGGAYHPSIVPAGALTVEQRNAACVLLLESVGLKWIEIGHNTLLLSDDRWPQLLELVQASEAAGRLALMSCWIDEPESSAAKSTWFKVHCGPAEFRSATREPRNSHYAWRMGAMVASERFVEVVRAHELGGLEILLLEDPAPSSPMKWYQVFSTRPIGRGLDHPLVDPDKLEKEKKGQGFDLARRQGEPTAWLRYWKDDVEFEQPLVPTLAGVMRPRFGRYFRVSGPTRVVSEFIPRTDFAYGDWGFQDGLRKENPFAGRSRQLFCSARARKALIDSGLMKPSKFEPVMVVPEREAFAVVLDRTVQAAMPLPVFSEEEAAVEQRRRIQSNASRVAEPRRTHFASIEDAVRTLERRFQAGSLPWNPAGQSAEVKAICSSPNFALAPLAWRVLLPWLPVSIEVAGEEGEAIEFRLEIPDWNDWLMEGNTDDGDERPSDQDLVLARTPYGDWFSIRATDPLLPSDAVLTHWDHETLSAAESWKNISAFAADLLDRAGRASGE